MGRILVGWARGVEDVSDTIIFYNLDRGVYEVIEASEFQKLDEFKDREELLKFLEANFDQFQLEEGEVA